MQKLLQSLALDSDAPLAEATDADTAIVASNDAPAGESSTDGPDDMQIRHEPDLLPASDNSEVMKGTLLDPRASQTVVTTAEATPDMFEIFSIATIINSDQYRHYSASNSAGTYCRIHV